jgi:YfiR/HmsC-like
LQIAHIGSRGFALARMCRVVDPMQRSVLPRGDQWPVAASLWWLVHVVTLEAACPSANGMPGPIGHGAEGCLIKSAVEARTHVHTTRQRTVGCCSALAAVMPAVGASVARSSALLCAVGRVLAQALACGLAAVATAQPAGPTADEVKAAYLHKIPGYVVWPDSALPSPTSTLVIGVLGAERVYNELARLAAGRPVQGRNVSVQRLARADENVHVLFIGNDAPEGVAKALAAVAGSPVVTVTEKDRGIEPGAVLNFVSIGGRVRFEVSLAAAERAGVRLSSRMLAVAERVIGGAP